MNRVGLPLVCVALAALSVTPAPAQRPAKDELEKSIDQALLFLRLMQEKDGAWVVHGQKHVGVSALATLAFLAAGQVPGDGPAGDVSARGLGWLLKQQQDEGVFASDAGMEMYHHGITTLLITQ